ncbi:hypothetical protein K504DRAFT_454252 [Pleomassaria siparia CBS 279.74]|uniref:Uncharacterized protein n=1 Tax=Pleomassaria siparia CBS 279.74 TaxID=1314801 RepID=A0A6G1JQF5_9PLEO|nr:hypothetical protein K504DRAFT_454252 [Pleomassaria siparia CBS 279.74]
MPAFCCFLDGIAEWNEAIQGYTLAKRYASLYNALHVIQATLLFFTSGSRAGQLRATLLSAKELRKGIALPKSVMPVLSDSLGLPSLNLGVEDVIFEEFPLLLGRERRDWGETPDWGVSKIFSIIWQWDFNLLGVFSPSAYRCGLHRVTRLVPQVRSNAMLVDINKYIWCRDCVVRGRAREGYIELSPKILV